MKKAIFWMAIFIGCMINNYGQTSGSRLYVQEKSVMRPTTSQVLLEEDPFTGEILLEREQKEATNDTPLSQVDFYSVVNSARPVSAPRPAAYPDRADTYVSPVVITEQQAHYQPQAVADHHPRPVSSGARPAARPYRTSHARFSSWQENNRNVPAEKVWAVVIGISRYAYLPSLQYTDDDASRTYAFLKSPQGGALRDEQIRLLIDEAATREQMLKTIREVFQRAGPNDMILLYFSGHGLPGAFLPYDFDGLHHKVAHEEIKGLLAESQAKYKMCIADACYSGSLLTAGGGVRPNSLPSLDNAGSDIVMLLSSQSGETSLECSNLEQGVFSHYLIRGLKGEADRDSSGTVSVLELYDYTYGHVHDYTGGHQSPVVCGNYDDNMTLGGRL